MQKKHNKEKKKDGLNISVRLYDDNFNVIFGLTKANFKEGLQELDELLKAKYGDDLNEILRDRKRVKHKSKYSYWVGSDSK